MKFADKYTSEFDIKFGFKFTDEDDSTQWITLPNPKGISEVKAGLTNIENLTVNNKILIGSKFKSDVTKLEDVRIINKTDISLDWRS